MKATEKRHKGMSSDSGLLNPLFYAQPFIYPNVNTIIAIDKILLIIDLMYDCYCANENS